MHDPRVENDGKRDRSKGEVVPHQRAGNRYHAATRYPDGRCQREVDSERAVREPVPVQDDESSELREGERHDREIQFPQLEAKADRADHDRDQRDEHDADKGAEPERDSPVRHRQIRRVRGQAERGGVEQRQLAGEAEDEVEADGEDAEDEREDQDRQDDVAVHDGRHEKQRYPEQQQFHRLAAKSPAGLSSRISTRKTRPYASLYAEGRKIEPTPSATPMMMPPANEPITLPMPARIAASTPFRM